MNEDYDIDTDVDETTGEILRPLGEVHDPVNDFTMYIISPLHSLSDVLRFVLANTEYDTDEFMAMAEEVSQQWKRFSLDG